MVAVLQSATAPDLACAKSLGFLGITHPIATPPNLYIE
jgi:hypothetical protein